MRCHLIDALPQPRGQCSEIYRNKKVVIAGGVEPIANWGLQIQKNAIKVNNNLDYQTNIS